MMKARWNSDDESTMEEESTQRGDGFLMKPSIYIDNLTTIKLICIDGLADFPFSHNLNQNTFLSLQVTPCRALFVEFLNLETPPAPRLDFVCQMLQKICSSKRFN